MSNKDYLTIVEASKHIGKHRNTIVNHIKKGNISFIWGKRNGQKTKLVSIDSLNSLYSLNKNRYTNNNDLVKQNGDDLVKQVGDDLVNQCSDNLVNQDSDDLGNQKVSKVYTSLVEELKESLNYERKQNEKKDLLLEQKNKEIQELNKAQGKSDEKLQTMKQNLLEYQKQIPAKEVVKKSFFSKLKKAFS